MHLMLLLLSFPKSKNFNHQELFTEFIDNLVNLKCITPLMSGHMLVDGGVLVVAFLVVALIISLKKWNTQIHSDSAQLEKEWKDRGVS
ncbi:hypothetical protein COL91_09305 [Bacillus pseudomycoides]|nr:hypothetical protein COO02_09350 [Bacillus pseudomycoides]PEI91918.1 hypothetical protein CN679_12350 [Bacillus pseudomycoides]PGA91842.1 hypothetical protein COL91_09305 [Bacillus pseudomycoides]PHF49816.1 hypothetical protein COF72_06575 [Bacillus pseudomycoides]